jgi:hypothetical protein
MAPVETRSSVTMSPVNIPLQQFLNPVLSIFLSSTLRILLALLLLVSCYTCIALSLLIPLPLEVVIALEILNVTICLHHWFVMTK